MRVERLRRGEEGWRSSIRGGWSRNLDIFFFWKFYTQWSVHLWKQYTFRCFRKIISVFEVMYFETLHLSTKHRKVFLKIIYKFNVNIFFFIIIKMSEFFYSKWYFISYKYRINIKNAEASLLPPHKERDIKEHGWNIKEHHRDELLILPWTSVIHH